MNLKSPEEEIDEFLSSKPSWLRKILQFDYSLSSEEWFAWHESDWWPDADAGASVQAEYEQLLKRSPSKWREHCKRAQGNALKGVSTVRRGRSRRDALADAQRSYIGPVNRPTRSQFFCATSSLS